MNHDIRPALTMSCAENAAVNHPLATPADPGITHTGERPCVLIVEDYEPNVMVLSLMLDELGFDTVSAMSGTEALHILEATTQPFHAILMDVQMHGMDGLETTRYIRDHEAKGWQPNAIIGVTAHALAGDRERCLAAGMDDYICKPVLPDILAQKLGALKTGTP